MSKQDIIDAISTCVGSNFDLGIAGGENASIEVDLGIYCTNDYGGLQMGGIIPNAGQQYIAKLLKGDWGIASLTTPVGITHLALGTGGGSPGGETATLTKLNNEVCRKLCYKRTYFTPTSGPGDWTVNGKQYDESIDPTDVVAFFFCFEGAEGSFSDIDEIALFSGVAYNTASVQTAVASGGNVGDYELVPGAIYYGTTNITYGISVTSGGFPGSATGNAMIEVESTGADGGQRKYISGFGDELSIGSHGLTLRFTQASGGDDTFTAGDSWDIYCVANKQDNDYAAYGEWSTTNTSGEVHTVGYPHKIRYLSTSETFSKSQDVDKTFIEIVEIE